MKVRIFRGIDIALWLLLILLLVGCAAMPSRPAAPAAAAADAATPTRVASPTTRGLANTATSAAGVTTPAASPRPLPDPGAPDIADYTIAVTLKPSSHQLLGVETVTYRNTAKQAFSDIIFHLYLNAFKDRNTLFMKESGGQLRGDMFNQTNNGWIDVTSIRVKDGPQLSLTLLEDGTLARATLPEPVAPGKAVALEIAFQAQLPQVFARTGWALDQQGDPFFLAGQWFPKPGVWTDQGWVADPFHANAEFFADFGRYDVTLTIPANYTSGGTGLPDPPRQNPDGTQSITYHASSVIDFVWAASPNLRSASQMVGNTELFYLYLPEHQWSIERVLTAAASAVRQFSKDFGPYPYARLTLTDVPEAGAGAGGMEYPTFVAIGAETAAESTAPSSDWRDGLAITTMHEVAHQWWQSMVATNEGREPWLDEGFADYSTLRLLIDEDGLSDSVLKGASFFANRRQSFLRDPGVTMFKKSWDYTWQDYVIAAYSKPDLALLTLQNELGAEKTTEIFHTYFTRYRFAHPTTADFRQVAQQVSGQALDWFFDGLGTAGDTINLVARPIEQDTITIDREGHLALPADVSVTFADGSTQVVVCQPGPEQCQFQFNGNSVQSYTIDPQHKLLVELDWGDNTMTR